MDNQVTIQFRMDITQDGNTREISFSSLGHQRLEVIDDALFMTLTYQEPMMDSDDIISVKMNIKPNQINIFRQGEVKGMQIYKLNEETESFILTNYGKIKYQVHTHQLAYDETSIHLMYELLFAGVVEGKFHMTIQIQPQEGVER